MKYAILPLPLIEELILKIQAYEMAMEESFGKCRTIQQLIEDGEMPHIYFELLGAKENAWDLESSEHDYKEGTSKMKFTRPSGIRLAEPDKTNIERGCSCGVPYQDEKKFDIWYDTGNDVYYTDIVIHHCPKCGNIDKIEKW